MLLSFKRLDFRTTREKRRAELDCRRYRERVGICDGVLGLELGGTAQPVRVDVRPEQEPNPIILSHGLCVARVYGWPALRRDRIAPDSVRLAGARPVRHLARDFDGDGVEDLRLYFQTASMQVAKDAT